MKTLDFETSKHSSIILMEEEFSVKKLLQVELLQVGQSIHFVRLVLVRTDTSFEL